MVVKNGFLKKLLRSSRGIDVIFLLHFRNECGIFFLPFRNKPERKSKKTMKIAPINCEEGSAWHEWQDAGYEWRESNRGVAIHEGAAHFANVLNANERHARYAAFKEGAEYFDRMELYQNHTVAFYAGH